MNDGQPGDGARPPESSAAGASAMPSWLAALAQTSLRFWEDPSRLTWAQAAALLPATLGLFNFARFPFTREAFALPETAILTLAQVALAIAIILIPRGLDPHQFGAAFLRLAVLHLALAMAALGMNRFYPFAFSWPPCEAALVSALFATIALGISTARRGIRDLLRLSTLLAAALVTCLSWLVACHFVLPPPLATD